ncbi:MAG: FAD-dependent oxidoreductase, partial [Chlamydiota bacterium]|nr:FAD-dependent oxidoreductase [Chlamydiota bacterium]
IIGGGDTALEEATFLTKFCSKVSVVHRRDQLRASKIMQQKAFDNQKIEFVWDSVVEDIIGEPATGVKAVRLKNIKTSQTVDFDCQGVFVAIGHKPNTALFEGQISLDEKGYIISEGRTSNTNIPGVFAAGDVQDHRYRQAITAAGTGCMAAIDAERYLEANETLAK